MSFWTSFTSVAKGWCSLSWSCTCGAFLGVASRGRALFPSGWRHHLRLSRDVDRSHRAIAPSIAGPCRPSLTCLLFQTINGSTITFDLFTKKTDTHQYLLPTSDHPPHVHRHLPYGLGVRLKAIVSDPERLEARFSELSAFLLSRGYSEDLINEQLDRVRSRPRDAILHSEGRRTEENRIPLVCSWNSTLPPLSNLLQSSFNVLESNEPLRRYFDLSIVSYRRPKNLRDLLVSTSGSVAGSSGPKADGTFPCETSRCKTCEAVHNLDTVDEEPYKVRGHFTCTSSSVVYLISCGKPGCEAVYVGETGCSLRERMNGHRFSIKNKTNTPVGMHFSTEGHNPRVSVIQKAPPDILQRRLL